ncbi:MAG: putative DNA primase [Streblomastix strix]|uniref:Putative DNA primase n=1 Tax=Streblomastix strix TaxID=222440 RepID=A0A5J4U1K0_9EUKA|nr:MAG: putative DNA primase [Streblomastix strix]
MRYAPFRFEMGAVYNVPPSERAGLQDMVLKEEQKEMVFDIDLSDYDDVRICCQKTKFCQKCWPLMHAAFDIVNRTLIEDFGFSQFMWVFSGRRGMHCWIGDDEARVLERKQREAIIGYFRVMKGHNVYNFPRQLPNCLEF